MNSMFKLLTVVLILVHCSSNVSSQNKKIKLIPSNEIQSLEELVNYKDFKNKVLYFTFWEVRSQPSIRELEYYKDLYDKYRNESVEFVFLTTVSSNALKNEEWKNTIYKYNLEGYHIQNNTFLIDFLKTCQVKNNSFPIFMIFNKQGDLKIKGAAKHDFWLCHCRHGQFHDFC